MAGYAVYGMDYPGFGMSEGLHGYVPDFDRLVDDVMEQYRAVKGIIPCFLALTFMRWIYIFKMQFHIAI